MATAHGTRFPWMTLWIHRSLLRQFTARYIHARHRGSILGFAWAFLNPLLMLALYTFIFSQVFEGEFRGGEHQPRYALVIFLGLMFYHLVADILATAPGLIVSNPNFVKKVVFPLEILPASAVGASLFHFGVSMILFLCGALLFQHPFTWVALWLPIIALPILILVLGLGWFLSALGVFLRDLQQVMGMINLILIYTSCIFFPPEKVASVAPGGLVRTAFQSIAANHRSGPQRRALGSTSVLVDPGDSPTPQLWASPCSVIGPSANPTRFR
jgi:lipopolysaccharide transport system permease protein